MPKLFIKNVPEAVIEKLRERAPRTHRSMQGELMVLVSEAVASSSENHGALPQAHGRQRARRTVEEIWETIQARYSKPVSGAPTALELIRADH